MRTGIILFSSILATFLLGIASGSVQQAWPETGTILKGGEGSGLCELDIVNNAAVDAAAYLCDMNKSVLIAVYIRSQEFYNMTGIEAGSYDLYLQQGTDWNSSAFLFENNSSISRMEEPLVFETVQTPEGVRYTWGQIILKESPEGNMSKVAVSEKDFPA